MIEYVIFNKELGLFFTGFGNGVYSKYIHKAHKFYSYGYALNFLRIYSYWFKDFVVCSLNQVSKAVLYA